MLNAQAALLAPVAPTGDAQTVEQPAVDLLAQFVAQLTGKTADASAPKSAPTTDDAAKDDTVAVSPLVPVAPLLDAPPLTPRVTAPSGATPSRTTSAAAAAPATVVATAGISELAAVPIQGARPTTKVEAKPAALATAAPIAQTPVTQAAVIPLASIAAVTVNGEAILVVSAVKPARAETSPVAAAVAAVAQDAPAPAAIMVSVQPAAASAAPPAPTAPVPAQHFTAQLSKPIFTLASAGAGEHVVTVKVTPENLGPITVRAHVGVDGMRVELFAPSDAGRDAIRSILPDLRKDLAGQGLSANLDLSSQNQPDDRGFDGSRRERLVVQLPEPSTNPAVETDLAPAPARARDARSTTIDVLV
jgi:flagellar hook-length control protein FliK